MLTVGPLNDLAGVRHGFFGRVGGVSAGLFGSLNCGFGSGDDKTKVAENRARAMAQLGLAEGPLVTAYQVHSPDVVVVEEPWAPQEGPRADAMVTRRAGIALGILTADCVPLLLAEMSSGVIAAAHAGWKGAVSGVVEATLEVMESLAADRARVVAAIGPAIAQRSYEVGPEFPEPFLEQDSGNADLFCPAQRDGHFRFDLKGYVARRLALAGCKSIQILPCDTFAEDARFFSYRRACLRGEKGYGRNLSAIYLEA